jgi:guanylate kinase
MNIELLKQRLIKRNSLTDTIERRLESDEKDFKDFNRYDLKIDSPDYKIEDILKSIGFYHN